MESVKRDMDSNNIDFMEHRPNQYDGGGWVKMQYTPGSWQSFASSLKDMAEYSPKSFSIVCASVSQHFNKLAMRYNKIEKAKLDLSESRNQIKIDEVVKMLRKAGY